MLVGFIWQDLASNEGLRLMNGFPLKVKAEGVKIFASSMLIIEKK